MKNQFIIDVAHAIDSPDAILSSDGFDIFELAISELKSGRPVNISLENVRNVTSGFFNELVYRVHQELGEAGLGLLEFGSIEKSSVWQLKLEDALWLTTNPEKRRIRQIIWDNALEEV